MIQRQTMPLEELIYDKLKTNQEFSDEDREKIWSALVSEMKIMKHMRDGVQHNGIHGRIERTDILFGFKMSLGHFIPTKEKSQLISPNKFRRMPQLNQLLLGAPPVPDNGKQLVVFQKSGALDENISTSLLEAEQKRKMTEFIQKWCKDENCWEYNKDDEVLVPLEDIVMDGEEISLVCVIVQERYGGRNRWLPKWHLKVNSRPGVLFDEMGSSGGFVTDVEIDSFYYKQPLNCHKMQFTSSQFKDNTFILQIPKWSLGDALHDSLQHAFHGPVRK